MLASNGECVIAGSRFSMYGGMLRSCRYALRRCTKVDFPAPAMPMVMITDGLRGAALSGGGAAEEDEADMAKSKGRSDRTGHKCTLPNGFYCLSRVLGLIRQSDMV